MKLTAFLLTFALIHAYATGRAQTVTLSGKELGLSQLFKVIEKQTGYVVLGKKSAYARAKKVSVAAVNMPLRNLLDLIMKDQPLQYIIQDRTIVLAEKQQQLPAMMPETAPAAVLLTGMVVDESGSPVAGVSVLIRGTGTGTATKADGSFSLRSSKTSGILVLTSVGYEKKEIAFSGESNLKVVLKQAAVSEEDVVINVGYSTQRKALVTGAVASMKMDEDRRNAPTSSLGNLLAGQMAGVNISTPQGLAGSNPGISIRQGTSWNSQDVLFVIDGRISNRNDFNTLSPNDIDEISVLKDASSAAAYGSRAAGGVILVTTRRGSSGKAVINYAFNTGVDKRGKNAPMTSAIQLGELFNRYNPNSTNRWSADDFEYFKNINNGYGYAPINYVFRDAKTTVHNLSASGGSEKVKYFIGGSYVKQTPPMLGSSYNRYNFRTNVTADITERLQAFANVSLYSQASLSTTFESPNDLYRKNLIWQPEQPTWTEGGLPIQQAWPANVGAMQRGDGGYNKNNVWSPVANLKLSYKIPGIRGLSAAAQFNTSFSFNRSKTYAIRYPIYITKTNGIHQISTKDADIVNTQLSTQVSKNRLEENYSWSNDRQLNYQLAYDHLFNNRHHVSGLMLYEQYNYQSGGIGAGRDNFPYYTTDQWWATSGDRLNGYTSGATNNPTGRKSWVGQATYDYEGKYLAKFSYRYDGSMNFAPDKRWGFFPSGQVGWVLSKEHFMKNSTGIDFLKLRGSVGLTGNDAVGGWQWQESYQSSGNAYFGTNQETNAGINYGPVVNPNLTWEKSLMYNAGLDINFLKKFNATVEYYFVKTYDILGQRIASVPPTFSRSLPSANYGQVNGQGVELNLGYRDKAGAVRYYINANASYSGSRYVVRDENITYPYQKSVGQSASRLVTRVATGMLRTQADVDALLAANPRYKYYGIAPVPGQLVYQDISGPDGKPDGLIDDYDQMVVKKNNDPVFLGINFGAEWKGLSIDLSFTGKVHQWSYINNLWGGVDYQRMWVSWYTDSWTPSNTGASLPWRYSNDDGTKRVTNNPSSFWLKNSGFVRLRYVNLAYSIPERYVRKIGLSNFKLFFSGTNLFIISRFNKLYYDPEIGDPLNFPVNRSFNFGINVSL
ncbi:SusC/RagA family TonB-linked outer membrane protein [Niabella drilacis]|nr:SusC/RagA family TonB-linked outer membrane protein [Niabella drilacis]